MTLVNFQQCTKKGELQQFFGNIAFVLVVAPNYSNDLE
jgi:hypothetical protein